VTDTIVFLGPSLPRADAAKILDATYLPPAQFGDVYRWIGSGVGTIVLIDGVFHGRAPVWQRELLAALRAGIRVYGAASMGALRAAELRAYGMRGLGAVYDAYASGALDGDDEVALLHASAEHHYRPLSEPLVNVRATLRAAVAAGVLDEARAAALVAHGKRLPFWARSLDALFAALSPAERAWYAAHAVDVKRADATRALVEVARGEPAAPAAPAAHEDRFRLRKRGFARGGDRAVVDGARLVAWLGSDRARRQCLQWAVSARFFVTQYALDAQLAMPARPLASPSPDWLRANALTAAEHAALAPRQALADWLLEQPGANARLDDLMPASLAVDDPALQPLCGRAAIARMLPWVAAWCAHAGAAPPPGEHAAVWAIERGPVYFGYATWSFATELLALLQWTGAAAALAPQVTDA
jgi:hypothetical protein